MEWQEGGRDAVPSASALFLSYSGFVQFLVFLIAFSLNSYRLGLIY